MLPVSDAFLAALTGSHGIVSSALLCDPPGQFGVNPTGRTLAVVDGSVALDGDAQVRGTADLEVAEEWPAALDSTDLTPYGAEVFLTRGVVLGNGRIERAPLGYYRLTNVEQDDAPLGPLRLTGQDRMGGIVEADLETPIQFAPSSTYGAVVEAIVTDVYPGAVIEWDDTTDTEAIGRAVTGEEDRYAFLLDVIQSTGKIMFWDYRGVLVIKDPPDPGAAVWTAAAGAGGVLTGLNRSLSRDGVYNAVVATGEALDDTAPPLGTAYDLDPTSPTYWLGPFGKVPRRYSSPLLTTAGRATSAAESLLVQSTGLPYLVDFTAVPNPALEPFDPIALVYPIDRRRTPHQVTERHVLAQITIPLGTGAGLTGRTRKVTL